MRKLHVPTGQQVAEALRGLTAAEVQALAERSGVPFHTLLKIKTGETGNPRIETVSQFWPHLSAKAAA
jgi:predicted transcriptional regulator